MPVSIESTSIRRIVSVSVKASVSKAESELERRTSVIRVRIGAVRISVIAEGWLIRVIGRRLVIDGCSLLRESVQQPGSSSLVETGPSAGRLIGSDVLLRVRTGITLHRPVLDNCHALNLLAVNDNRLCNTLLYR